MKLCSKKDTGTLRYCIESIIHIASFLKKRNNCSDYSSLSFNKIQRLLVMLVYISLVYKSHIILVRSISMGKVEYNIEGNIMMYIEQRPRKRKFYISCLG